MDSLSGLFLGALLIVILDGKVHKAFFHLISLSLKIHRNRQTHIRLHLFVTAKGNKLGTYVHVVKGETLAKLWSNFSFQSPRQLPQHRPDQDALFFPQKLVFRSVLVLQLSKNINQNFTNKS